MTISRSAAYALSAILAFLIIKPSAQAETVSRPSVKPGFGWPGTITPYPSSEQLSEKLGFYGMEAYVFRRDSISWDELPGYRFDGTRTNAVIPFTLFRTQSTEDKVPLVIMFGGTGEHGTDLSLEFRQPALFAMVTSPKFQKIHPCHVFAPMLPKDGNGIFEELRG